MTSLAIAQTEIEITGTQEFLGKQMPVIEGGFGEGKRSLTDKVIGEIHNQASREIRRRINDNIKRFKEGIDLIDLKREIDSHTLENLGYVKQSIKLAEHIYLLSERGYAKLIKIMDSDLAWDIHDKLMDEYFAMRKEIKEQKPQCVEDLIIMQAQSIKDMRQQINQANNNALRANQLAIEAKEEAQAIKEVVSLDTTSWRSETQSLIARVAKSQGGFEHINMLRTESYELLNKRFGVSLETRLTNKKRRMALEGVSKSKLDKLNNLDIIAEDKKLIEGYVAIVKDMAIKYGI